MVIDDDADVLFLVVKSIFQSYGEHIHIEAYTNSIYAAGELNKRAFDLIITDHVMPELTGLMLVEQLRENPGISQSVPILLMTGNLTDDLKKQIERYDNCVAIEKPFDYQLLERCIADVLGIASAK